MGHPVCTRSLSFLHALLPALPLGPHCLRSSMPVLRTVHLISLLAFIVSRPICRCQNLEEESDEHVVPGTVHTLISTECTNYFGFQSLAIAYSHKKVGQPGPFTRIMSCKDEDLEKFSKEDLEIMDTFVAPYYSKHPETGDFYPPYNKPTGALAWLNAVKPKEEWILFLDADMLMRQPFIPEDLNISQGWALGCHYNYLRGTDNQLAETHIPEVAVLNDTFGGPKGRKADQVGAYYLIRRKDFERIAPLWLKYTENVRQDKTAWNLTGDSYAKEGASPWISEMYGWIYGAAKMGLRHKLDPTVQLYPSYAVRDIPNLVHYGLAHHIGGYSFDKHNHYNFDFTRCPSWNTSRDDKNSDQDYGLFPHPPFPSQVALPDNPRDRYGELMNIEFVNVINEALCERHKEKCPPSAELDADCAKVDAIGKELELELAKLHKPGVICHDDYEDCKKWKAEGKCEADYLMMADHCRVSCGMCRAYVPMVKGSGFEVYEKEEDGASRHGREEVVMDERLRGGDHASRFGEVGVGNELEDTGDDLDAKEVDTIKPQTPNFNVVKARCLRLGIQRMKEDIECVKLLSGGLSDRWRANHVDRGFITLDTMSTSKPSTDLWQGNTNKMENINYGPRCALWGVFLVGLAFGCWRIGMKGKRRKIKQSAKAYI